MDAAIDAAAMSRTTVLVTASRPRRVRRTGALSRAAGFGRPGDASGSRRAGGIARSARGAREGRGAVPAGDSRAVPGDDARATQTGSRGTKAGSTSRP